MDLHCGDRGLSGGDHLVWCAISLVAAHLADYFLGGKTAPWWAIALSIVSAETSTLTGDRNAAAGLPEFNAFLQLVSGYLLGRLVIVTFFLPAYFRGEMYTAYEKLMRVRFGERIRRLTAAAFLVLRAGGAEGGRVFAVSIVISIIFGVGRRLRSPSSCV